MEADRTCPHCGAINPFDNVVCSACSYPLASASPALVPGHILKHRYQIIAELGRGGFAAVYKAKDLQLQSAVRAIKEMDDTKLSAQDKLQAITAFEQEARILVHLMHSNLPRIYDHFTEQQRWYLVMDYIDGETVESILARSPQGKLPVEKVIEYALQLCKVLKYLHTQVPPIIFRDLKPSNMMIGGDDILYLIDFGIARFFKVGQLKDTIALGSHGYAAPEQYGREQTTELADIYSFGATLHHLLSGRDPSHQPFIFPPLQLEPSNSQTQALTDLVAQMVAIKKEERPGSIPEIQSILRQSSYTGQPPPVLPPKRNPPLVIPPGYLGPQVTPKWSFSSGDEVVSSPTAVNGSVYFGSHDHKLYALDANSGRQEWFFVTGSRVKSSPTVANGSVYCGSGDQVYALDAASGLLKWSFSFGGEVRSSPRVFNGSIYFGSYDYKLYALDAASGRKLWSFSTGGWVRSSPTVVNGLVYFGSYDRRFYALDAASGVAKWSFSTGGRVYSSPTVVNGLVYFGSGDYNLYALDAASGRRMWTFPTGGWVHSSPTVADGLVYFGSDDYNLHALDAASGRRMWSFPTGGWVHSSPTIADGLVYFGSDDHKLYALDASSGQKLWSFQTGGRVQSSPTVVNGIIYVGSRDGNIYAIFA